MLAVVAHQVEAAEARVVRRELADPAQLAVPAAVVDEHDLEGRSMRAQSRVEARDESVQSRGGVEHGDDGRDAVRGVHVARGQPSVHRA